MTTNEHAERCAQVMREHGMSEMAIAQFSHLYDVWAEGSETTWIREDDVEPLRDVPSFHDIYQTIDHNKAVEAFGRTAFIKLNGGLGTSMGLSCAK